MNCQEVMELMQRQLDNDLEDGEIDVMMNHTRQCPDCAAMFERMKLLSAELTNLPKVTPPYSLVDAIMPELLRIDEERKQAKAAADDGSAAEAASHSSSSMPRRSQSKRRWTSWGAFGSVVAAGIVAGIFLIMNPPGTGLNSTANNSGALVADADHELESLTQDEMAKKVRIMHDAGGDSAPGGVGVESYTGDNSPKAGSAPGSSGNEADGAAPEMGGQMVDQYGELASAADDHSGSGEPRESEQHDIRNEDSVQGLLNGEAVLSPDGRYIAKVGQYTVRVEKVEDGSLVMETARKNGQFGQLAWTEDGTELTYEVRLDQGAIEKYVVSTADWNERKAAH